MSKSCAWDQEDQDGDTYGTDCGHCFTVTADTPEDNGFCYCCFCGKPLEQRLYEEDA